MFDLATDTNAPLCVQKVVRKAHLTRLAFNPTQPVLVVGDDRQVAEYVPLALRSSGDMQVRAHRPQPIKRANRLIPAICCSASQTLR